MPGNVDVLLRKANDGVAAIAAMYQRDLDAKAQDSNTPRALGALWAYRPTLALLTATWGSGGPWRHGTPGQGPFSLGDALIAKEPPAASEASGAVETMREWSAAYVACATPTATNGWAMSSRPSRRCHALASPAAASLSP